ncbi:hypothetical protein F030043B2_35080 [Bacteroides fragilis]
MGYKEATGRKTDKFPANICTKTHIKPGKLSLSAGQSLTYSRAKALLSPEGVSEFTTEDTEDTE